MVSVIAMGNTVQSFRDHSFLSEKLYTGTPEFGEQPKKDFKVITFYTKNSQVYTHFATVTLSSFQS